jgi:hypothetical protein
VLDAAERDALILAELELTKAKTNYEHEICVEAVAEPSARGVEPGDPREPFLDVVLAWTEPATMYPDAVSQLLNDLNLLVECDEQRVFGNTQSPETADAKNNVEKARVAVRGVTTCRVSVNGRMMSKPPQKYSLAIVGTGALRLLQKQHCGIQICPHGFAGPGCKRSEWLMTAPVDHFSKGLVTSFPAHFENPTTEQRDSLFNLVPLQPMQWHYFRFDACDPEIEHVVRVRIAPGAPESDLPLVGVSTSDAPHIMRKGEIITDLRGNVATFSREVKVMPGNEGPRIRIALFSDRRYGSTPYELSVLFAGTPGCPMDYSSVASALGAAVLIFVVLT